MQGDDDTGSVTVTDDGWIHYDSRLEELGVESETLAVDGVPGPDGACTASGQETGSASDTAITVREEVAFNPATCDSVYLVPK